MNITRYLKSWLQRKGSYESPRKQTLKASKFSQKENLRMTILPRFSQILWNLKFIFSGSNKKLFLVLLQLTNDIYSPSKV